MSGIYLISEELDRENYEIINENSKQDWYLRGVFGEAELINRNRRKYPTKVMTEAVEKIQPLLKTSEKILGEYHHPPTPKIDSKNACIQIQKLCMESTRMMGEAKILRGTQWGNHLIGLLENGIQRPVSTRALGDVSDSDGFNLVNEMTLITVDVVDNQSCPTATPNAIYEDINWMYDIGSISGSDLELLENFKRKSSSSSHKKVMSDVSNFILEGFENATRRAILKAKLLGYK
jgi:hypothetical protein